MAKFWKWLDGKKSKIALVYWSVIYPALPIIFDDKIPGTVQKIATILGYALTALGLGHAGMKALTK